jgi:secondary thiamine-phosphate synthase enzyme
MREVELDVDTSRRKLVDLTDDVTGFAAAGGESGLLNIYVPHATCGIVLMETGSGSEEDLVAALERLLPRDDRYLHHHGSTGHGADHLLPALVSPAVTIPVRSGILRLGTWQRIVLVDLNRDNPRRRVILSLLEG